MSGSMQVILFVCCSCLARAGLCMLCTCMLLPCPHGQAVLMHAATVRKKKCG